MTTRATTTIIFAVLLILVVMAVSAAITFMGFANTAKFSGEAVWETDFTEAQSMKILDFTGDGQDELFVQNPDTVALYDQNGNELFSREFNDPISTTLGDVNGDHVVNLNDLMLVLEAFGACPLAPATCPADLAPAILDGQVDHIDLMVVVNNWG